MKYLAAALVYALLIFVLGLTRMSGGEKIFLSLLAMGLLWRMTGKEKNTVINL